MKQHFKDAQVVTNQPLEFESDQVEFEIHASEPNGNWKVLKMNSPIVSISHYSYLSSLHVIKSSISNVFY